MTRSKNVAEFAHADTPDAVGSGAAVLPKRMDRKTAAQTITNKFFPVAARSLKAWPINWIYVNGRAVGETDEILSVAQAKLNAARIRRSAT